MSEENLDKYGLIKATYHGNTPEVCCQIIESYLDFSGFGNLIAEHPTADCNSVDRDLSQGRYDPLGPFKHWWNDYISDEEGDFVDAENNDGE
tara:strand:+ start:174 stop:449 length:276 start_codon:yes stop_codon:yes gene_type:complete